MIIPRELSLLISSDPRTGVKVSSDGSRIEVPFSPPLEIPKDAINVTVCVEQSTIWWTVPNLTTGVNNSMYIFGDLKIGGSQLFNIVIPQGLYDLNGLQTAILTQLEAAGARTHDASNNPLPLINLLADSATQKVMIRFNYPNVYVDFNHPDTPRSILGFDALQYGPYIAAPLNIIAPNIASFNTVNSFLITSDLVTRGIGINNQFNSIIAQILIDVPPGSQIVSQPFNPARVDAQTLAGAKRDLLRFSLTDERLNAVNTNGEAWTCRIVIRWYEAAKIKTI